MKHPSLKVWIHNVINSVGVITIVTYPDVRITDNERFAISLKAKAGFRHQRLNE